MREKTSNVAILITDYYSSSYSSLQSAANLLQAANIFDVYAVGIRSYSYSELRLIASDPSFVFTTYSLNSFTTQQLEEYVIGQLCSSKLLCTIMHMFVFLMYSCWLIVYSCLIKILTFCICASVSHYFV